MKRDAGAWEPELTRLSIEVDETDYLSSSPANKAHLLKAMDNIAHNRNLVTVDLDDLS